MSITNFTKPSSMGPLSAEITFWSRAPLVHVATSNQTAQPDFKYLFQIEEDGTQIAEAYVTANPAGVGMIDLAPYIRERLKLPIHDSTGAFSIHYGNNNSTYLTPVSGAANIYEVVAGEVYTSGGTLTEFAGTSGTHEILVINGAHPVYEQYYSTSSGLRQDWREYLSATNAATPKTFLTRLQPDTYLHIPEAGRLFNLYDGAWRAICIPTHTNDLGQVAWVHDTLFSQSGFADTTNVLIRYYDADDTPLYSITINATSGVNGGQALNSTDEDGKVTAVPAHQGAQTNNSLIGTLRNVNAPTWSYYIVRLYDVGGVVPNSEVSDQLIFFNHCEDRRHKHYQLAWDNGVGFFDYYTFTLKSEHEEKSEKKYYSTNIGSWEASSFSISPYEHGTKPFQVNREKRWKLSTGKVTEATAEYLRALLYSRRIDLIDDEGNVFPVTIEDTNFTFNVDNSPRMREYTFTVKLAQHIEA